MLAIRFGLVFLIVFQAAAPLSAESLTLTTSYPAPSGVYQQLLTTGQTILDRDTLSNGGRVGVGTAAPGSLLDVNGTAQLRGAPGGTGLVVNGAGNVGIGTASPNARLNIEGDLRIPYSGTIRFGDNDGTTNGGGGEQIANTSPDGASGFGLVFRAGFVNRMVINSTTGGIGIGTVNPLETLDVNGPIRFNNNWGTGVGGGLLYSQHWSNEAGLSGRQIALMISDPVYGNGNNNDEIWIGPNGGGYYGSVQLVSNWLFISAPGGAYSNGGLILTSDARLKTDIDPIASPLERLSQLHGVRFRWKDPTRYGRGTHTGLLAQDVEKVFPDLVSENPQDGMKAVAYGELIGVLVESIKELKANNEELQRRVQKLEKAQPQAK